MKTKDKVLELLKSNSGEFLSGQNIADELHVTRACVWKCIKALIDEGNEVDAVTNKGYRLKVSPDDIDIEFIKKELLDSNISMDVVYYDEVTSTNDVALSYVNSTEQNAVVIANGQTNGKGRRGRNFYSPKASGLYMSVLLNRGERLKNTANITAIAACAVSKAIDDCLKLEDKTRIKWVNDIFYKNKKVCGILSEAHTLLEDDGLSYVVIGIGVNVFNPENEFPKEIKDIAGNLIHGDVTQYEKIRSKICVAIIRNLFEFITDDEKRNKCLPYYREKSMLDGSYIKINSFNGDNKYAKVIGIGDEYQLLVEYENGTEGELTSGEVSVAKY